MTAADLIRRAADAGVTMTLGNAGLQLQADRQPPGELLAELVAHKVEIIAALSAANDPMPSSAWLARVARLLGTRPAVLLEDGHLTQHDLVELAGTDAAMMADTIRRSPAWINRPQRVEQSVERIVEDDVEPQRTVHTAATASPEWLQARDHYNDHIFGCRACYGPLSRHCAVGADLRQRYDHTPMEASE